MTKPSPTNKAPPSRTLLPIREADLAWTMVAFRISSASMTDFDVSPTRILFGDDLANAVRHGLHVRQQLTFLHLLVLHRNRADVEPDVGGFQGFRNLRRHRGLS